MSKIKVNFIYLSLYKILEIFLPMITSPILSRRLGAESLGRYSYVYSIVSIFATFAQLGIYNYGMREIAKVRDDKKKLNQTYSDIFFIHIIVSLVVIVIYCGIAFSIKNENKIIFIIQIGVLVSNMIDNAFLFIGLERVKELSIRDTIIKIMTFILIVLLIKKPSDIIIYTLIMVFSAMICRAVALLYGLKFAKFVKPSKMCVSKHLKPMTILMLPTLASTIYQSMDKVMIGWLYDEENVGYYECASKSLIPKNFITTIGTVMCPHIANLYQQNKIEEIKEKVEKSLTISLIFSYLCTFGIIAIAKDFAPWFWGEQFSNCSNMMIGLAISIPVWTIGEVIRNQLLLPIDKDNEYMISFVAGVIVNAIANIILIPKYAVMGAIVATLISEVVMSGMQLYYAKRKIKYLKVIKTTVPYLIISLMMMLGVREIRIILLSEKLGKTILLEVLLGALIYIILVVGYEKISKNENILKIIENIGGKR